MVDITDTHNTRGRLGNEWAKLLGDTDQDTDPAPIDDRDRRAIETFVQHRRDIEDMSRNTLINDLGNLRRAAERADTPLVDMDIRDARGFISELVRPKEHGGYGLDPDGGGIYNYKRALRVFFTWLDNEPGYGDYPFGEGLELPSMNTETIDDEEVLTEHEIEDLKDAANSARDRALVDFLADVGARISLVTSLRVGDIKDIESDNPGFVPNDNAINLKGVEIRRYPSSTLGANSVSGSTSSTQTRTPRRRCGLSTATTPRIGSRGRSRTMQFEAVSTTWNSGPASTSASIRTTSGTSS